MNSRTRLKFFGIPKIWPYASKYKKIIFGMISLGLIVSVLDVIFPLFNRYAINHFVGEGTLDTLKAFILLYVVLLIFQTVTNYIDVCLCSRMEMYMDRDLRNAAFNHVQELSFSYFNRNNVGYIHARVISDSGKIGELMAWRIMDVIWYGSYLTFVAIMMLILNFKLALLVLLVLPVATLLISYFQKKLIHYNRKVRELNSNITSDFNEGITGAKSIKTMVIEDKMINAFNEDTKEMKFVSVRTAHFASLFAATVTLMSSVALAIVLLRGGYITVQGVMEIGTLSVFMSYALGMIDPLQNIINSISAIIAVEVNIERYSDLMATTPDVTDSPEVIEKYGDTFNPKKENWEKIRGDIEFKDVDFMYPDGDTYVLKDFNLKVPAGTNVAIVGETGAGKSTLVNLVCRFFEPTSGSILLDGVDERKRSQLFLHSNIGYVLQTPHLFSGTVRENLRYGKADATDEEIMNALKLVSADFIVDKLKGGLDAEVGEDGGMLSTGEKQLLSFARAIISDPAILVLDEATSSIDTYTEKLIQDAVDTVTKGRTSFIIAHRLSTIVDADVILVVDDGKIIEKGTHKELMALKGVYYDLFTRQYDTEILDSVSI